MSIRLTAAFPRKSNGRTIHRALASLEGAAKEALPMFGSFDTAPSEFLKEAETLQISFPRTTIVVATMFDEPATYRYFLPEKNAKGATLCTNKFISSSLSHTANELLRVASGDYVLFMSPGEVCLDPSNIIRTLDFLDSQPQIDVVSCPVKVYSDGEHVKTHMVPKILRRNKGNAAFTGVLADNWEPCNDLNWLLSASGLTFMDHGDAWRSHQEPNLVDLKLLLHDYFSRPWPEDDLGRVKAIMEGTKIGQLLAEWNPNGAFEILTGVLGNARVRTPDVVPALVARARSLWRYEHIWQDKRSGLAYEKAMADLNEAIKLGGPVSAWLERGFLKHGVDGDCMNDLLWAVNLAKETTTYGLDMRELALAQQVLNAKAPSDAKRCQEKGTVERDSQCLLDADGHRTHIALDCGVRATWMDP